MNLMGLSGGQYRALTDAQVETIHEAALGILEKTGFTYEAGLDDMLALLAGAGAWVDAERQRIFFPRGLVTEQAAVAPESFTLFGRGGKPDIALGDDRVHLGTGGAAIKILDLETGEARSTTLSDMHAVARVVDRCENIHFFLRSCIPTDIPEAAYDVNTCYACLRGTGKHVMSGIVDEAGFAKVIGLASLVAGGREALAARPIVSVVTSFAISPLKFCTQSTRIMMEACRKRVPVALSAAPMAGSTSPVTMAGTLAQLHAEQLAGITVCQLANPGAPLLYGGIPGMANMRTMGYQGGSVEFGMMNAAIHQLARRVKVPNYNSSGLSDSKVPDAQAAWEKAFSTLLAAMGGSNFIHHAAGMLESMLCIAHEQYILDDEIIGMACKVLRGIEVDPEHLALDVIDAVGPGGNFMTAPHTMEHVRSEYFAGNGVSDRKSRARWEKDGAKDARERAREMARGILSTPEKNYIPEDIDREIRKRFEILL